MTAPHVLGYPWVRAGAWLLGVLALAFVFAQVEIQIEGSHGWAASLPVTFRYIDGWFIEHIWGGRPITGYHVWALVFLLLVCHWPMLAQWTWSPRQQVRALAAFVLFWVAEDLLWFLCNPAFGWAGLRPGAPGEPGTAWWHRHWFLGLPVDYWVFSAVGLIAAWWSFREPPCAAR